jgi:hypothetical protein
MNIATKLDRVKYLLKHLPGKHNQQLHDPHKGTGSTGGTLYHYTRPQHVESIMREGIRKSDGNAGVGIYLTDDPESATTRQWSTERIEVELDPDTKILEMHGIGNFYSWEDTNNPGQKEIGQAVMDAGYDALRLERTGKSAYTVVYNPDVVTITGHTSMEEEYVPTLLR